MSKRPDTWAADRIHDLVLEKKAVQDKLAAAQAQIAALEAELEAEYKALEEAGIDQCNWVAKAGIFQMKLVEAEQGRQAYRDLVHAMDVQATKLTHMEGDEEIIHGYQFNTGLFHALLGLLAGANHG